MAIKKKNLINEGTEILKNENNAPKDDIKSANSLEGIEQIDHNKDIHRMDSKESKQNGSNKATNDKYDDDNETFKLKIELNAVVVCLFIAAFALRFYELDHPNAVVFDELHYGRFVSLYLQRTFFFESQPPLGKQLIALSGYFAGYKGQFANNFTSIGTEYDSQIPIRALRFVPVLAGSLLVPLAYQLSMTLGFSQWTAFITAALVLSENSLLTQSRFILLDSILLLFSFGGLLAFMCSRNRRPLSARWLFWIISSGILLACGVCVKYIGVFTLLQVIAIAYLDLFIRLADKTISNMKLWFEAVCYFFSFFVLPVLIYTLVFYIHLSVLVKAGPHDNVMTSAFQASLEGGLASIIRGQPRDIVHGSQITLRNTHGRTCWLHSHPAVYPVKYPDSRGSSHQQQVTCYSFKDVNNWWIVKRPTIDDLTTYDTKDAIKDGDIIHLQHGISGRLLVSHDIAAPMSPYNQEVSCYIDYNVSMVAQPLWKVKLLNPEETGGTWHTINSRIQLIHVNTTQAMKLSGAQLPSWGFNQHEVVTDKQHSHENTVWNVEEHRYTKASDEKEREKELGSAEFVPLQATQLSFWQKMFELQYKIFIVNPESVQNHMFASDSPLDWVLLKKGIAYWLAPDSNAQIYLIGNCFVWLSGVFALLTYCSLWLFYFLRRTRQFFDIDNQTWYQFLDIGQFLVFGYFIHFVPHFLSEKSFFLHQYLPSLMFKILLVGGLFGHISKRISLTHQNTLRALSIAFLSVAFYVFYQFLPLTYGTHSLNAAEIEALKWRQTWQLLVQKP